MYNGYKNRFKKKQDTKPQILQPFCCFSVKESVKWWQIKKSRKISRENKQKYSLLFFLSLTLKLKTTKSICFWQWNAFLSVSYQGWHMLGWGKDVYSVHSFHPSWARLLTGSFLGFFLFFLSSTPCLYLFLPCFYSLWHSWEKKYGSTIKMILDTWWPSWIKLK